MNGFGRFGNGSSTGNGSANGSSMQTAAASGAGQPSMTPVGPAASAQAQLVTLQNQVQNIAAIVNSKEKALMIREAQLKQGQVPYNGPADLERNLVNSLGPSMAPGNVGDINKVIWPYWYTTDIPASGIALNQVPFVTGFTNTYEAAFIWTSMTKTVYLVNQPEGVGPILWEYLNPNNEANDNNQAPGLFFTIRDNSSARQFYNMPVPMAAYGNPRFPFKFPRPMMILPNQEVQIQFTNNHPSNVYVPFITVFGYRMRIEDSQQLLGLVYGGYGSGG